MYCLERRASEVDVRGASAAELPRTLDIAKVRGSLRERGLRTAHWYARAETPPADGSGLQALLAFEAARVFTLSGPLACEFLG